MQFNIDDFIVNTIKTPKHKSELYGVLMKEIADICGIRRDNYVILGSYPMRMYKAIGDLDVDMADWEWDKLTLISSQYLEVSEHPGSREKVWTLNMTCLYSSLREESEFSIQVYRCDPEVGYFASEYKLSNIWSNREKYLRSDEFGNFHYSLQTTLRFKEQNNRPKDHKDIQVLRRVLGS